MFAYLHSVAETVSARMPLEWFAFLGSVTEEVIAPIPSFVIMTVTGSVAATQGYALTGVLLLGLLGALGKTAGAWLLYVLGDKAEDVVLGHWGRRLGLSHQAVEHLGERLGKGWKDDVLLFFLRAIPAIPSAPVSVLCGVIRIRKRSFLLMTFLGCLVRDTTFALVGFGGVEAYQSILRGMERVETLLTALLVAAVSAFILWCYWQRSRGKPLPLIGRYLER